MMDNGVTGILLDTSFLIRHSNKEDSLHKNAKDYFKHFLKKKITIKVSTIAIAEYCVKGKIQDLPLQNIMILPFNIDHAEKTGEFAKIIFENKKNKNNSEINNIQPRAIIPNDCKLFTQADCDKTVSHFITSDKNIQKLFKPLQQQKIVNFQIIDLNTKCAETFGFLDI